MEQSCCCTGNAEDKDCCTEEAFFFQMDNDRQIVQDARILHEVDLAINGTVTNFSDQELIVEKAPAGVQRDLGPPPKTLPIWLLNCRLTYYG